jgi:hypothetical protein
MYSKCNPARREQQRAYDGQRPKDTVLLYFFRSYHTRRASETESAILAVPRPINHATRLAGGLQHQLIREKPLA